MGTIDSSTPPLDGVDPPCSYHLQSPMHTALRETQIMPTAIAYWSGGGLGPNEE
jgi:hypothetical protein